MSFDLDRLDHDLSCRYRGTVFLQGQASKGGVLVPPTFVAPGGGGAGRKLINLGSGDAIVEDKGAEGDEGDEGPRPHPSPLSPKPKP